MESPDPTIITFLSPSIRTSKEVILPLNGYEKVAICIYYFKSNIVKLQCKSLVTMNGKIDLKNDILKAGFD